MLGKLGKDAQLSLDLQAIPIVRQSNKIQGLFQQDPLITEMLKAR